MKRQNTLKFTNNSKNKKQKVSSDFTSSPKNNQNTTTSRFDIELSYDNRLSKILNLSVPADEDVSIDWNRDLRLQRQQRLIQLSNTGHHLVQSQSQIINESMVLAKQKYKMVKNETEIAPSKETEESLANSKKEEIEVSQATSFDSVKTGIHQVDTIIDQLQLLQDTTTEDINHENELDRDIDDSEIDISTSTTPSTTSPSTPLISPAIAMSPITKMRSGSDASSLIFQSPITALNTKDFDFDFDYGCEKDFEYQDDKAIINHTSNGELIMLSDILDVDQLSTSTPPPQTSASSTNLLNHYQYRLLNNGRLNLSLSNSDSSFCPKSVKALKKRAVFSGKSDEMVSNGASFTEFFY